MLLYSGLAVRCADRSAMLVTHVGVSLRLSTGPGRVLSIWGKVQKQRLANAL